MKYEIESDIIEKVGIQSAVFYSMFKQCIDTYGLSIKGEKWAVLTSDEIMQSLSGVRSKQMIRSQLRYLTAKGLLEGDCKSEDWFDRTKYYRILEH